MTFEFSELTRLVHQIETVDQRVPRAVRDVIKGAGEKVRDLAKDAAPKATGYLADTIEATMTGNGDQSKTEVGPTAFYGKYVEEGTAKMSAQPYLGPSLDRVAETIGDEIADAAAKAF